MLIAFILLLALFPLESAPPPATKTTVVQANYNKCIKFTQSGPNRSAYSFYNGCGVDLWITACAKGSFDKTQLFKSARTIPINGRFTIYPFFDIDVRNITWSADPYQLPPTPALCAAPAKKK